MTILRLCRLTARIPIPTSSPGSTTFPSITNSLTFHNNNIHPHPHPHPHLRYLYLLRTPPSTHTRRHYSSSHQKPKPTIAFIPGAWHGPWTYQPLAKHLARAGFTSHHFFEHASVVAPHVPPVLSHDADAAKLFAELQALAPAMSDDASQGSQPRDVVLVAHSYGGIVASSVVEQSVMQAAGGAKGKGKVGFGLREGEGQGEGVNVVGCVFVAAVVPRAGESMTDMVRETLPQDALAPVSNDPPSPYVHMIRPEHFFYHDIPSASERQHYASQLRPQSVLTFISKRGESSPGGAKPEEATKDGSSTASVPAIWHRVPCGYVTCAADRVVTYEDQLRGIEQARRDGSLAGWSVRELEGGHSPMLSRPEELAGSLVEIFKEFETVGK